MDRRNSLLAGPGARRSAAAARAQQPQKLRRIGVLSLGVAASENAQWARLTFAAGCELPAYEEGQNLAIEWRYAEGDVGRLPALAEELARLKVELIMASFNDAIAAAKGATSSIPIVMFNSINPVERGFDRASRVRRHNITGTAWSAPEVSGKILQVLTKRRRVPSALP
jgi:putative ABC transport system substrate-binding protein